MKLVWLRLGPRLSAVSWFFIELFSLVALFFLPFSKSVSDIAIIIALSLWFLRKIPWDEKFPSIRPCNASYGVFLVLVLLSLFRVPSADLAIGLRGLFKWLKFLGIFFMFFEYARDKGRVGRLVAVFLASTALLCLNGFYQMSFGHDLIKHYSVDAPGRFVRMQSSLGSPNGLACFLIAALPVVFYLWLKHGKWDAKGCLAAGLLALFSVALALTRQDVPTLDRAQFAAADDLRRGGYILADAPHGNPDLILIASGSEVALIVEARQKLLEEKIAVRIVSMPSWELFEAQTREYRDTVLPPAVGARLAVEAGVSQGWHRYVGDRGDVLGVDRFGASAPGNVMLREYGFTVDNVCARALALLR